MQHLVLSDRDAAEHTELEFFLPFIASIYFPFTCLNCCISFQIAFTVTKNEFREGKKKHRLFLILDELSRAPCHFSGTGFSFANFREIMELIIKAI